VSHASISIPGALALAALVSAASCQQWHLSINSDGLLFISVIGDNDRHRDRFRVRIQDADGTVRVQDVPASGRLTVGALADGPLELTLLPPAGCQVEGANPRTMTVAAGETVRVDFNVQCQ
jgi:hypothetical protein